MWNPDHYQRAIVFAGEAHAGQLYSGSQASYVVHLAQVAMEIMHTWSQEPGDWNADLAVQCALLHDCLEDTPTEYKQLAAVFGTQVARGVLALTKDQHQPKSEQMMDSLARIRSLNQPEIAMVKLADRITNLQSPPPHWDRAKILRYQEEARVILDQIGYASDFLADRLNQKIKAYNRYLD